MDERGPALAAELLDLLTAAVSGLFPGPVPGGADRAARGSGMNAPVDLWLTADATPVHDARALTEGGSLARIVLDGQVYALRITRAGKLILTK